MRVAAIVSIPLVIVGCSHASVTATSSSAPQTNSAALDGTQQQVEEWRRSHLSAFTTLGDAMGDLGEAMGANDWNAIHTECAELAEATHAMSDALPSPDESLNVAFKGVLDNLNSAMIECPSLDANSDNIDAKTFMTNIHEAANQLDVAKDIME